MLIVLADLVEDLPFYLSIVTSSNLLERVVLKVAPSSNSFLEADNLTPVLTIAIQVFIEGT